MKNISGIILNEDALVVGISASGLWMLTEKHAHLKMAWMLVKLAWRVLRRERFEIQSL